MDTDSKVPGQFLPSELVFNKIQYGGGRHIENHIFSHNSAITRNFCLFWLNQLNGNNSAVFEQIHIKFDMDTDSKVPGQFLPSQTGRFRRSRSSKVDEFGANRKRICDFLLDHNSNLGPILHRFGDLTAFVCS